MSKIVRSSKHSLKFANSGKIQLLTEFLAEYRKAVSLCIDYIWDNRFERDGYDGYVWQVAYDLLSLPKYLDYKKINYQGKLSARVLQTALEQAIDIIRSLIKKRSQLLWVLDKIEKEPESKSKEKSLNYIKSGLYKRILKKPEIGNIPAELSSKCVDFYFDSKHFDLFVRLHSSGFDHIKFPVQYTKPFNKRNNWKLLTGIAIFEDKIILRQETTASEKRTEGKIIGIDPGVNNLLTMSDGQTDKPDIHGHTYKSIMQKLTRKKKDSKSFERAQRHRDNYINWSINQLNFDGIKQINIEVNNFQGSKRSRFLSHNTHGVSKRKLESLSEGLGVFVSRRSCTYKSQRCFGCSLVDKKNRNKKSFECVGCHYECDSDLNASLNNSIDLPAVPKWVVSNKLNRQGFLWKSDGLFDKLGQALIVPDPAKE